MRSTPPIPVRIVHSCSRSGPCNRTRARGFTLLELLVVTAIIAIASAGVVFALRDSSQSALEREGERLAALLESARAQSRASGVQVRWQAVPGGFRFDGLRPGALPQQWLEPAGVSTDGTVLVLGPEPLIGAQAVVLTSAALPHASLRVASDGLRPFEVRGDTARP